MKHWSTIRLFAWFMPLLAMTATACVQVQTDFKAIPPGPWRGILKLESNRISANPKGQPLPEKLNLSFEEVTAGELPFNFEVVYENDTTFYFNIQNAGEQLRTPPIEFGRTRQRAKDTLRVSFEGVQAYLTAFYEENLLEGLWVVGGPEGYRVPFVAYYGQNHRFTTLRKPVSADLSGQWIIQLQTDSAAISGTASFTQQGNDLKAAFTLDGRALPALEGTVQADKAYLSRFDGANALLLEAKIRPDGSLIGSFRSGLYEKRIWEARRQ